MKFKLKDERKVSKWRLIDFIVCFIFWILSPVFVLIFYPISFLWLAALFILIFIAVGKSFYYLDEPKEKHYKTVTCIIRSVLYPIAILSLILPLTLHNNWKWYYPVQKAVFLSNYTSSKGFDFLPNFIPMNAEDYQVNFRSKILQGEAEIIISFYTDIDTLKKYEEKALAANAEIFQITDEKCVSWFNNLTEKGIETEGAVIYEFESRGWYTPIYIINENTGYFMLHY